MHQVPKPVHLRRLVTLQNPKKVLIPDVATWLNALVVVLQEICRNLARVGRWPKMKGPSIPGCVNAKDESVLDVCLESVPRFGYQLQ